MCTCWTCVLQTLLSLFVLLVSSLLNGFYYLPIVIAGFFKKRTVDVEKQTIPMGAQISLILLIGATFFFGLFSDVPVNYITPTVQGLFGMFGGGS